MKHKKSCLWFSLFLMSVPNAYLFTSASELATQDQRPNQSEEPIQDNTNKTNKENSPTVIDHAITQWVTENASKVAAFILKNPGNNESEWAAIVGAAQSLKIDKIGQRSIDFLDFNPEEIGYIVGAIASSLDKIKEEEEREELLDQNFDPITFILAVDAKMRESTSKEITKEIVKRAIESFPTSKRIKAILLENLNNNPHAFIENFNSKLSDLHKELARSLDIVKVAKIAVDAEKALRIEAELDRAFEEKYSDPSDNDIIDRYLTGLVAAIDAEMKKTGSHPLTIDFINQAIEKLNISKNGKKEFLTEIKNWAETKEEKDALLNSFENRLSMYRAKEALPLNLVKVTKMAVDSMSPEDRMLNWLESSGLSRKNPAEENAGDELDNAFVEHYYETGPSKSWTINAIVAAIDQETKQSGDRPLTIDTIKQVVDKFQISSGLKSVLQDYIISTESADKSKETLLKEIEEGLLMYRAQKALPLNLVKVAKIATLATAQRALNTLKVIDLIPVNIRKEAAKKAELKEKEAARAKRAKDYEGSSFDSNAKSKAAKKANSQNAIKQQEAKARKTAAAAKRVSKQLPFSDSNDQEDDRVKTSNSDDSTLMSSSPFTSDDEQDEINSN